MTLASICPSTLTYTLKHSGDAAPRRRVVTSHRHAAGLLLLHLGVVRVIVEEDVTCSQTARHVGLESTQCGGGVALLAQRARVHALAAREAVGALGLHATPRVPGPVDAARRAVAEPAAPAVTPHYRSQYIMQNTATIHGTATATAPT